MSLVLVPLLGLAMSPLSLPDAVERALARDSTLAALAAQQEAARSSADAVRANYGPKLRLEGNVILWDDKQTVAFGGGGAGFPALPPPTDPYQEAVLGIQQALSGLGTPTTVREQVTAQATVQVVQPLAGLYAVNRGARAADLGVEAARRQSATRRRSVELETVQGYFRTLQAQALARAAAQQVESLESQEKRILSLFANGVVGKNDVLRLQVGLAAARQQALAANGGVRQAQAALAMQVGATPGETFELSPAAGDLESATVPALDIARERAAAQRPEVAELSTRVQQSEAGEDVARARLLPDVNLIAQYDHTEGNTFQASDSLFGGLFLTWTAWEWGATARQADAAVAQTEATRATLEQVRKGVVLEVESVHVQLETADAAIGVAEGAVAQAEENLRLERARLEAQQATSGDLIDAETALLQARVNLENARYDRLVARARLRAAMGQPILDTASLGARP